MKDAHTMMNQEDEVDANSSKYASLTAGLLARKGEAVPAAAAFTAEAIAQHIPARRLAQEAERVLTDRQHPKIDGVIDQESAAARGDGLARPGAQVVADHRDMIEQAFHESAGREDDSSAVGDAEDPLSHGFSQLESQGGLDLEGLSLGKRRELDLPSTGSSFFEDLARAEREDGDENWFDDIVSNAINEAEDQRPERQRSDSGTTSFRSKMADTLGAGAEAEQPDLEALKAEMSENQSGNTALPDAAPETQGTGCSDKASKVRQAIKLGKTSVGARSAMRLDPRRYIRLSLAAQKLELTSQEVMVAALDTYLDALDEEVFSDCACMKKGLI